MLGAGASFHAGYPLAAQLGDAVRVWLDGQDNPALADCRAETDYLCTLYGGLGGFEDILTDLDDPAPGSPSESLEAGIRSRLLNQFLTSIREFLFTLQKGSSSLYYRLVRECIRPEDTVITFNYDVEVERELRVAGLWEITDGYGFLIDVPGLPRSRVPVLKLHGSANWLGLIFRGSRGFAQVSDSIGGRPVIFCRRDFAYLGCPDSVRDPECSGVTRSAGIPAMIMPTRNKRFYVKSSFGLEWEGFWGDLWSRAGQALEGSEQVVIIGYSMAPADERARALLLERIRPSAYVSVCCRGRSRALADELVSHGIVNVDVPGDGSFESFLSARNA